MRGDLLGGIKMGYLKGSEGVSERNIHTLLELERLMMKKIMMVN